MVITRKYLVLCPVWNHGPLLVLVAGFSVVTELFPTVNKLNSNFLRISFTTFQNLNLKYRPRNFAIVSLLVGNHWKCKSFHRYCTYKLNPLSANPTKWSNTLKQFVAKMLMNFWVCLTTLCVGAERVNYWKEAFLDVKANKITFSMYDWEFLVPFHAVESDFVKHWK